MALSGHWFGRRVCPLLGVKQTSLFRDRGPLMTESLTRRKPARLPNSTFPAKNCGLPAPRIRENPIQATEMQGSSAWM